MVRNCYTVIHCICMGLWLLYLQKKNASRPILISLSMVDIETQSCELNATDWWAAFPLTLNASCSNVLWDREVFEVVFCESIRLSHFSSRDAEFTQLVNNTVFTWLSKPNALRALPWDSFGLLSSRSVAQAHYTFSQLSLLHKKFLYLGQAFTSGAAEEGWWGLVQLFLSESKA